MNEFDRERAHRKADDLPHLKDEADETNTEHLQRARRVQKDSRSADRDRTTTDGGPRLHEE
ncbi:hypothetical protein OG871_37455 [Kitasatospora sp. NBC_00374]|uniref:hypothetical protein n=1 Tax=Kitasatospora sp. NBC_00374 TaxID=2975964 RepID=UPI0030E4CADB